MSVNMKIVRKLIGSICIIALFGCSNYPKDVQIALKESGENRNELENVIRHYSLKPEDSLKLKAAYFLIGNMPDQYYIEGRSLDLYNEKIFEMHDMDVGTLMNTWDSIRRINGNDFITKRDIDIIDAELLIENIDMAFQVWTEEWNNSLKFEEFCEYILPYKSANEKPEKGWRKSIINEFSWLKDSVNNKRTPMDICIATNMELKKWYKLNLDYQYPVDIGYKMAKKIESGSCDMGAKAILYPLRALGIPATYDYAPFWANRSGRHNWNSIIHQGKHKTFNGGDNDVGSHKVEYIGVGRMKFKPAKVLRKTYAVQKNTLPFLIDDDEDIPEIFNDKRIIDVTHQYIPVSDVHLNFPKGLPYNSKTSYLCTFNNKEWQIYYWGLYKKHEVVFKNMGRDVAYLPVVYKEKNIIPVGDPFILSNEGQIFVCKADTSQRQTVKVTSKYPEDESNKIFPGDNYELLFWKNGWVSLGLQIADTNYLVYENAPLNALFWIRNHTEGIQERIFTYEKNKQVWW
jgi:hypothetical protein